MVREKLLTNCPITVRNVELMLVNTVRENFKRYTRHDVKRAREARRIQGMIANPTKREFAGMVRENF